MQEKRELLADLSHEIWVSWMNYLFSKCREVEGMDYLEIPASLVERWKRQCETPYSQLSEQERNSDREQADKIITALAFGEIKRHTK